MEIRRVCEWCGKEFTAQTVKTQYCSKLCNNRAYKHRKRQECIELTICNSRKKLEEIRENQIPEIMTACLASMYIGVHISRAHKYYIYKGICGTYMPSDLRTTIGSYEAVCLNRTQNARTVTKQPDNSFNIIRHPDGTKIFSVPSYRTDIISTLKERFRENITIMKPTLAQELIRELCERRPGGTYLENGRADVRTVYYQDGQIKTSATLQGERLPPIEDRVASRQMLCEIADYPAKMKGELQAACGYNREGSIHFENAYYPVILHD